MKAPRITFLAVALAAMALGSSRQPAEAVIEQIYSLPFAGQYTITCGFQWYSECNYPSQNFHYGTDYALGLQDVPPTSGHPVQAAAKGTAKSCLYSSSAGYSILMKHGDTGHRTRYLHLREAGLPSSGGQTVAVGQVIGYEGSSGEASGPHLHFEVRHNAGSSFTCTNPFVGTAVDPYAGPYSPGTYSWKTSPPSTARDLDFSGDGHSDVLAREPGTAGVLCLVAGNGAGGWIANSDPGCRDGSPIGWDWDVFDRLFRPGDFSGDGCHDVLSTTSAGVMYLTRGNCAGSWMIQWPTGEWSRPIGWEWNVYDKIIGPGDFSGDGCADVLSTKSNGTVWLTQGDCAGGWKTWSPGVWSLQISTGFNMYNWLLAPSDFGGNGDSCPDVVARQSASPYWMKLHYGRCGVNGNYIDQGGVSIETAWSAFDWLLSVGDFSGDVCSDVLRRYGGGYYLDMRRGNCNGGFVGGGSVIGYEWNLFNWIF